MHGWTYGVRPHCHTNQTRISGPQQVPPSIRAMVSPTLTPNIIIIIILILMTLPRAMVVSVLVSMSWQSPQDILWKVYWSTWQRVKVKVTGRFTDSPESDIVTTHEEYHDYYNDNDDSCIMVESTVPSPDHPFVIPSSYCHHRSTPLWMIIVLWIPSYVKLAQQLLLIPVLLWLLQIFHQSPSPWI
jgi:hypothetical protein